MKQKIAILQLFLKHMTGQDVAINIRNLHDVVLLERAYQYAIRYFEHYNVRYGRSK